AHLLGAILDLPLGAPEGVVDGELRDGHAVVAVRLLVDHDVVVARHRQTEMYAVEAGAVMVVRHSYRDLAGGEAAVDALERFHFLIDQLGECFAGSAALEAYLDRGLQHPTLHSGIRFRTRSAWRELRRLVSRGHYPRGRRWCRLHHAMADHAMVQATDGITAAGRAQPREQAVHQAGQPAEQHPSAKTERHAHVLEVGLVDRRGVVGEAPQHGPECTDAG